MSESKKVLISIEGKNIEPSVLDTNDISVQRGGSYELLDTALQAGERLKDEPGVETVSLGASRAVFVVNEPKADNVLQKLGETLKSNDKQMFTNFVVGIPFSSDAEFGLAEKKAIAVSRWRQMQRSSIGVPELNSHGDENSFEVCELDRVRPKAIDAEKGDNEIQTSDFVENRRQRGIDLRSREYQGGDIYTRILVAANQKPFVSKAFDNFTDKLNELAIPDQAQKPRIDFRLHNKIAILYADGNKFGSTAANKAELGSNQLKNWDQYLRSLRAKLLKTVLETVEQNDLMIYERTDTNRKTNVPNKEKLLRFETLEWGGDELMWVVPAFMGFELARLFVEETKNWQYQSDSDTQQELLALHHGMGLVFCHHKAPIARVRKLVRNLGDLAKPKAHEPNETRIVWTALESFDHLGLQLGEGLSARFNGKLTANDWVMTSNELALLGQMLSNAQKQILPRTQIVSAAVRCVHDHWADADKVLRHAYRECFSEPSLESFRRHFEQLSGKPIPDLKALKASDLNPSERRAWIMLAEAFDYMGHVV
jgi:hypothetical protein